MNATADLLPEKIILVNDLVPNELNQNLVKSILKIGVQTPIVVKAEVIYQKPINNKDYIYLINYQVIRGNQRVKACIEVNKLRAQIGLDPITIPAVVENIFL